MTKLKAIAPRIYIDKQPYVQRYPMWFGNVYYQQGSIVSRPFPAGIDSDSEVVYYNYYVAQREIQPYSLPPENNSKWTLWVSGDPNYKLFQLDSEVFDYLNEVRLEYLNLALEIDSDIAFNLQNISNISGYDSELRKLVSQTKEIRERNIIDSLFDSEAQDGKAIAWDSDNQRFKFIRPVLSVNGFLPNAAGEVNFSYLQTKTGARDDRLDSDLDGTIFIVVGDSDSEAQGLTYSYVSNKWVRVIGFTEKENDVRYVNLTGDTMTGNLLLKGDPVRDSEAATKAYVDNFNDSDKQDKIIILNTLSDLLSYVYEESRLYFVKENNSLWIFSGGGLRQFTIPRERVFNPVMTEAITSNLTGSSFDITVKTYRFSSQVGGTLSLARNNNPTFTPFALINNVTGTYNVANQVENMTLVNSAVQSFKIRVPGILVSSDTYNLIFTTHDGLTNNIIINSTPTTVTFSDANRIFNFGTY